MTSLGLEDVALEEPRVDTPILPTLQVIHPPDRPGSHSDIAKLARAECKKPLLPDRLFLNSYLPHVARLL